MLLHLVIAAALLAPSSISASSAPVAALACSIRARAVDRASTVIRSPKGGESPQPIGRPRGGQPPLERYTLTTQLRQ